MTLSLKDYNKKTMQALAKSTENYRGFKMIEGMYV